MFKQKKYAAGSFDSGYHGLSFESLFGHSLMLQGL